MKTGEEYFRQYEPFFGSWYIRRTIGEGSYGQVYEIERNEFGRTYQSALKAISIPQNRGEIRSLSAEGMTAEEITGYYDSVVRDIINEYVLMSKLKGNSNIVSYEDHAIHRHKDNIGYDILIRMELLTPLTDYVQNNRLTRRDVIRLGIDICKALELCRRSSIIHRDIKPENIFVSQNGDFKLGDFGIARSIDRDASGLSKKGTYTYMAPELYKGEACDFSADIYSLGIVMYRLLNFNRTPFLPDYPKQITYESRESALVKRISGLPIPAPANGEGRLGEIVLKACAYDPKQRFDSAEQLRNALEAVLYQENERILIYPAANDSESRSSGNMETGAAFTEATPPMQYSSAASVGLSGAGERTAILTTAGTSMTAAKAAAQEDLAAAPTDAKRGKGSMLKAAAIGAAALLVAGGVFLLSSYIGGVKDIEIYSNDEELGSVVELKYGDTITPTYRVKPSTRSDEKISFESRDEETVTVSEDGTISAIAVGSARIELRAGKYSEELELRVEPKVTDIAGLTDLEMTAGGRTEKLKPVLLPEEYGDEEIIYTSQEPDIASVDSGGTVKALKAGAANICIESGGFSTSVKVRVKEETKEAAAEADTTEQTAVSTAGNVSRKSSAKKTSGRKRSAAGKSGSGKKKTTAKKSGGSRKSSAKKSSGSKKTAKKSSAKKKKKASGGVKW